MESRQKCDCFLAHTCTDTERSSFPLTWQGTLLMVVMPIVFGGVFLTGVLVLF